MPRETRHSMVEKKCLAVMWALDSFRYYLMGRKITLETVHRAIAWLDRMKDTNARITLFLAVQPFDFKVIRRTGPENSAADFLSRTQQRLSKRMGRKCHEVACDHVVLVLIVCLVSCHFVFSFLVQGTGIYPTLCTLFNSLCLGLVSAPTLFILIKLKVG